MPLIIVSLHYYQFSVVNCEPNITTEAAPTKLAEITQFVTII